MMNGIIAFGLSAAAGASTGLGGLAAVLGGEKNRRLMAFGMGFSAGVMLCAALRELLTGAIAALGGIPAALGFLGGMALYMLTSYALPEGETRHGLTAAVLMAVHNFPEGMATFVTALNDPAAALPVILAVALHNIPEGMAVAAPVLRSTGRKARAFRYSFLSGLTEPLGALCCWLVLAPCLDSPVLAFLNAVVAGCMAALSSHTLLPDAPGLFGLGGFATGVALFVIL